MKPPVYASLMALAMIGVSGGLFYFRQQAVDAEAHRAKTERDLMLTRTQLASASTRVTELEAKLIEFDTQLGAAKVKGTASDARAHLIGNELAETKSALSEREQREVALLAELENLRQQTPASTAPAVETSASDRRIADLQDQLVVLLTRELEKPSGTSAERAKATATHQVVRVGAGDAFVVLDYGTEHGASAGDTFALVRGTQEVARVHISDSRPRFSIAHVLPGTAKGQLQPGDLVLLTR